MYLAFRKLMGDSRYRLNFDQGKKNEILHHSSGIKIRNFYKDTICLQGRISGGGALQK